MKETWTTIKQITGLFFLQKSQGKGTGRAFWTPRRATSWMEVLSDIKASFSCRCMWNRSAVCGVVCMEMILGEKKKEFSPGSTFCSISGQYLLLAGPPSQLTILNSSFLLSSSRYHWTCTGFADAETFIWLSQAVVFELLSLTGSYIQHNEWPDQQQGQQLLSFSHCLDTASWNQGYKMILCTTDLSCWIYFHLRASVKP